jgi:sarcosine oxidase subunit beta
MFSQRGQIVLFHSPTARDAAAKRANTMRMNGIDAEMLTRDQVRERVPHLDFSERARFPIVGGILQRRAGTARHDAVAWGYARAADSLGVDIIQNCEVTGILREGGRVTGVETTRGVIHAGKVGLAVAGNTSRLAAMAGMERLPIETHKLQAFVSEPLKPLLDYVVAYALPGGHFYISQSDKGGMVFGGDLDQYNSYAQRGNLPIYEDVAGCAVALMPCLKRIRLLRQWAGVMDMSMDGSHIISKTPVDGLYLNGGWCYGGFKATPASGWCFAWTIAKDEPHELNAAFTLDRFERGLQIDEKGVGPTPKLH